MRKLDHVHVHNLIIWSFSFDSKSSRGWHNSFGMMISVHFEAYRDMNPRIPKR
jgi:hypothetical protein